MTSTWQDIATAPKTLDKLIERARNHVMTPAERQEQRRSWVRGEMMLSHPEMTREQVDALLDDHLPPAADATPKEPETRT